MSTQILDFQTQKAKAPTPVNGNVPPNVMTKRPPVLNRDQPEAAHVSWTQRVLSWFRRG